MYQTDLTETEWQYITKVLNLQERKRKYDLRMIRFDLLLEHLREVSGKFVVSIKRQALAL